MKDSLSFLYKSIIGCLATVIMTACTDTLEPEFISGSNVTGDGTSISITVPLPTDALRSRANTRADETGDYSINSTEGTIHDLHILFYNRESNDAPAISYSITESDLNAAETDENGYFHTTVINLNPKLTYSVYVAANLSGRAYKDSRIFNPQNISESDLRALMFDWTDSPVADNLPMVFEIHEISPEETSEIIAEMTIAAVKVRYNLIFDPQALTAEQQRNIPSGIKINGVTLAHRATDAFTVLNEQYTSSKTKSESLAQGTLYTIGDKSFSEYFNENNYDESTGISTDKVVTTGMAIQQPGSEDWTGRWIYQGTIYLPERYVEGDSAATSLTFAAEILDANGNLLADTEFVIKNVASKTSADQRSLPRGHYYEWSGLLASAGNSLITELTVRPWTSQELVYQLHGPYELIVEKTQSLEVESGKWAIMGFKSDIPDDQIRILQDTTYMPVITWEGKDYPFFRANVIFPGDTDDFDNPYEFNDEWPSHMRVTINPDIPYAALQTIQTEGLSQEGNYVEGQTHYKFDGKTVDYFHITAGNINKRIAVGPLKRDATLHVNPNSIIIDLQEKMASGLFGDKYSITFQTNVNITEQENFTLTIKDNRGQMIDLMTGVKGSTGNVAMMLEKTSGDDNISNTDRTGVYKINEKTGELTLNLYQLLGGNDYWNTARTDTLVFTLTSTRFEPALYLEDKLVIEVKPFSTNYIVHFKDNTKTWNNPHIYVYQLLTMPIDLLNDREDPSKGVSIKAGQTVGYIDDGGNFQGAIQYMFSNNISFKGWRYYGGPDTDWTDPYYKSTYDLTNLDETMGFVIFGDKPSPDGNGVVKNWGDWFNPWGYHVARRLVYNYEVNLNSDHENSIGTNWKCDECLKAKNADSDYNGSSDTRAWPGIAMEQEEDGWWKYTLTGIATPGRTFFIFANGHQNHYGIGDGEDENTNHDIGDREDYRWPGDSQVGVPLFDYTDNEGWFLFNGNCTDHDQNFMDDKPAYFDEGGDQYPAYFTEAMVNNIKIMVKKPTQSSLKDVTIQGITDGNNVALSEMTEEGDYYCIDSNQINSHHNTQNWFAGWDGIDFGVTTTNSSNEDDYKTIKLKPINFSYEDGKYVARVKLEFEGGEKLYIKWRDWNADKPRNRLRMYWNKTPDWNYLGELTPAEKIGNYQCVEYTVPTPGNDVNKRLLQAKPYSNREYLEIDEDINIYDIQQHYYPADKRYHVILKKD